MIKEIFVMISDTGNVFISKFITYFGLTGIGVGTVQAAASSKIAQEIAPNLAEVCSTAPSWIAIASAVGALSFAVKNIAEIVFRYIEHKEAMK
ncbi:hypothetical protein JLT2_29 [Paraglaciecola Antarctic JLT virus 2]|nr:hypothetical protein JLT2_29 [Paraglaciecola Antarctic JLT virus 2]